jgi:hypothetical protein
MKCTRLGPASCGNYKSCPSKKELNNQSQPAGIAWTKNPKFWVGWSLMVANDVSIPRKCFSKISELLKRNWLRAAHI